MLTIKVKVPTNKLLINNILAKLFQSYIYHTLDDKEHEGYSHSNGKVFKSMNFKIAYIDHEIQIQFVALDKENEKIIAQKILMEGLKLGEIHIVQTELSLTDRHYKVETSITVGGFVCTNIQDGIRGKKKIYLEPKSDKFQEILYMNTLEKYEALFGKPYEGELHIRLINQKPRERIFYYSKGVMKAWYAVYKIEANTDMLTMILDTGMGANCMKGLGFVEKIQ